MRIHFVRNVEIDEVHWRTAVKQVIGRLRIDLLLRLIECNTHCKNKVGASHTGNRGRVKVLYIVW